MKQVIHYNRKLSQITTYKLSIRFKSRSSVLWRCVVPW